MSRLAKVQEAAAKPYRKFGELQLTEVSLRPSQIERDPEFQIREKFRLDKQQEYAELWQAGTDLSRKDPLVIFYIDEECRYVAIDCWHRLAGWEQAFGDRERSFMYASGSRRDAKVAAMGANPDHGLPRTNADKRRAVQAALADPELVKLSNIQIADLCAVSDNFVGTIRREVGAEVVERVTKDGRIMNTKDLGAKPKADQGERSASTPTAPKLMIEPKAASTIKPATETPVADRVERERRPQPAPTYVAPANGEAPEGFTALPGGGLTYEAGDASTYFLADGAKSVEVSITDPDGGSVTLSLHSLISFVDKLRR